MKNKRFIFIVGFLAFFAGFVLNSILSDFHLPVSVAKKLAIQHSAFPVHLKVDFGDAGKANFDENIQIEKGTTPKEAVSQVFPVLSGKSCCSLKELSAIDGVKVEPAKNEWWICLVNGSKNISPQKKKLKAGDLVEWKYIHEKR